MTAPRPYIKLICASEAEKASLISWAKDHDVPASKYLLARLQELQESKPKRPDRRLEALQARVQALEAELQMKDGSLADLRAENLRLKDLCHERQGSELPMRLIKVIEKEGVVSERMLQVLLGIGPDDKEWREAMGRQLEELEAFGMIKKGANGWRWVK